ncbi:hypothetical protein AURDEDRAFT_163622 [Auricularia subglabra TFB-10046 SS5]|nr:hypothetical protein AURDEDRAFT_163622 [Auricularia subglabra TFB-10046 SS5]
MLRGERPLRPLYSFVALALHPCFALGVTGPAGGSTVPVNTAPATMPAEGPFENRHHFTPHVEASLAAPDEGISPYAPHPRFRVIGKDVESNLWVCLNAPTDEIPPPPNRRSGPLDCCCTNVDGFPGPRYGETQSDGWRFSPTWLDAARPGMPFIPDLFSGAGPCFAHDYTGLLQQWDPVWVVEKAGKLVLRDDVASYLQHCDSIDKSLMVALELRTAADTVPPPGSAFQREDLKRQWDRFVGVTQERRGRILERLARGSRWETFKEEFADLWYDAQWAGYYNYPPVGVWIKDTHVSVKKILQFIEDGVPVYYLWKPEFWTREEMQPLCPRFAYRPKTPPGSPPEYHPTVLASAPEKASSPTPKGKDEVPKDDEEFPEDDNEEFWEEASLSLDKMQTEERASARARIRSPPPLLVPRSPVKTHTPATGANRTPVARPLAGPTNKETRFAQPEATLLETAANNRSDAARPVRDKTAGELFTLVPPPLKLRLQQPRSSFSRLQRLVSAAMASPSEETDAGQQVTVRDGIAEEDSLPVLERRMLGRRELPRLFVFDILSVKMKIHTFLAERKNPVDELRLMQFLISVNIQYVSGVTVPSDKVDSSRWVVSVRDDVWQVAGKPHYVAYQQWRRNLSELLNTPRIARAVRAKGGLIGRITKYDGSILDVWREPTPEVYAHGSPRSVEFEGQVYYGDWLSDDKMQVFVGATGPAGAGRSSILPPVDVFDKFYDGFWSTAWETWFSKRIDEIKKGTQGTKVLYTAHEWERMLKGSALH